MQSSPSPEQLRDVLPAPEQINQSRSSLYHSLPSTGVGFERITKHLEDDIVPGLNKSSQSPHYYGFVTGGTTPAAAFADNLVTLHDQNLSVHLPDQSVATNVEDAALGMICDLLRLSQDEWTYRTLTTGATASNVVGLACGREYAVQERGRRQGKAISVGEDGLYAAMRAIDVDAARVLTTVAHSSLQKAASIVGLGRSNVVDLGRSDEPHRFDMQRLKTMLADPGAVYIVTVSCAEVNTGHFATTADELRVIRDLCTEHGAWLHIDAAFGLLARLLPANDIQYRDLAGGVEGMHLADSITGDAHKLVNVPYDCGIFLSRHLPVGFQVFQNPNAAYLDAGPSREGSRPIPPPLNIGIENSRRFRALPVYATLAAYGRHGYLDMLERQVGLARQIARYLHESPAFELLPSSSTAATVEDRVKSIYIIVLFRAKDEKINQELVARINSTRQIFVSGTKWEGRPAARFAVANWQVDVERDLALIKGILSQVVR